MFLNVFLFLRNLFLGRKNKVKPLSSPGKGVQPAPLREEGEHIGHHHKNSVASAVEAIKADVVAAFVVFNYCESKAR